MIKIKINSTLPYLPSRGWNTGKGDCRHYRSQLGFCITDTGAVAACRKEEQALSRMGGIQGRYLDGPYAINAQDLTAVFSCNIWTGPPDQTTSSPDSTYQNSLFKELGTGVAKSSWVSTLKCSYVYVTSSEVNQRL